VGTNKCQQLHSVLPGSLSSNTSANPPFQTCCFGRLEVNCSQPYLQTMTTIITDSPLPALNSPQVKGLSEENCNTYYRIFQAERYTIQELLDTSFLSSTLSLNSLVIRLAHQSLSKPHPQLRVLPPKIIALSLRLVTCTIKISSVFICPSIFPVLPNTHDHSEVQTSTSPTLYPLPTLHVLPLMHYKIQ